MFHIIGLMLFSTLFALAIAGLMDAFGPVYRRLKLTVKHTGHLPEASPRVIDGRVMDRFPRGLISASR